MDLYAHEFASVSPPVARSEDAPKVEGAEVAPFVGKILKTEGGPGRLVGVLPVDEDRYAGHR
jgi:hypothetical protein